MMVVPSEVKRPELQDYFSAKEEYKQENNGLEFKNLSMRKQSMLAKNQMYYREFHELCDTIKNIPIK